MSKSTIISKKHLLGISDLSREEIVSILDRGDHWANASSKNIIGKPLENAIICNLFFEPSTRTRFSFEVAAKKLGSHVLNFSPSSSSTQKGETIYDTIKTLEAMGTNIAIIRYPDGNILGDIAKKVDLSIVNAGDGTHEHPTQALLDVLTMRQHFGQIEGLKVAIIGDILHSRVAHSNMLALEKLGAEVMFSGPEILMPQAEDLGPSTKIVTVDEAVENADVVMMLRVQLERHKDRYAKLEQTGQDIFGNYLEHYGLTVERSQKMKPNAMIMHPAPFNRDVEIDGSLVEGDKSLIYKQVANGVAIRMAVLERAINS